MRYILQRPIRNSEVIPIERGSIITYRRNLWVWQWKKIFSKKNNVWKDEEEAHKDGINMSYRDEVEAREVSQSKERQKVGRGQKMSDER